MAGRGAGMKRYHDVMIIVILVTLIFFLYDKGLGAIPLLLTGVYLGFICVKEIRYFKKSKRL